MDTNQRKTNKIGIDMKIRVTLSGSGFRFPAHIGALAAIEDAGYEIIEFSGTSGGAIVAAMRSLYTTEEMLKIVSSMDFKRLLQYTPTALINFSYCNGSGLKHFFREHFGDMCVKDLKIQTSIIATNILNSSAYCFTENDDIVTALKASTAVPFLYKATKKDKMFLIDGGIVSNIPTEFLTQDFVLRLGVKLTSNLDTTPIKNIFDIISRSANCLFESSDKYHIEYQKLKGALFTIVNTGDIGSFNVSQSKQDSSFLYETGYSETRRVLDSIFRDRGFGYDYKTLNAQNY